MSIEIVRGVSRKPVASAKLIDILSRRTDWSGRLFVGYPIARTSTGPNRIDALWISEEKGIVAFDLIEGTDPGDHGLRQDDSANQIERRLRGESGLVRRRRLRIPIHTVSFAPAVAAKAADSQADDYPLAGADSVIDELARFEWPKQDPDAYRLALSVIDKVSRIRSGRIQTDHQARRLPGRAAQAPRGFHRHVGSHAEQGHPRNRRWRAAHSRARRVRKDHCPGTQGRLSARTVSGVAYRRYVQHANH